MGADDWKVGDPIESDAEDEIVVYPGQLFARHSLSALASGAAYPHGRQVGHGDGKDAERLMGGLLYDRMRHDTERALFGHPLAGLLEAIESKDVLLRRRVLNRILDAVKGRRS